MHMQIKPIYAYMILNALRSKEYTLAKETKNQIQVQKIYHKVCV